MVTLHIENLGKVNDMALDIDKSLIVLCGPNNSGKTYVSTVLYGLYESLYGRLGVFSSDRIQDLTQQNKSIAILQLCDAYANHFYANLSQKLSDNLPELFGAPADQFNHSTIKISAPNGDHQAMRRRRCFRKFPLSEKSTSLTPRFQEEAALLDLEWTNGHSRNSQREAEHIIEGLLKDYLIGFRRPLFFPAERSAINLFARDLLLNRNEYLNRSLIQKGGEIKPRAYAKPIQDNIRFMETISKAGPYLNSPYADLAESLETQALQGKVKVSSEKDLEFITHDGVTLDTGMTSSLVKSLAGIVFYFRHSAYERDILFIDEPEANLHPQVQRLLTRVLVSAVNRGIKIVLSTHSDIVLQELNNLIMLSQDSQDARELAKKYQVTQEQMLKPDKLAVYVLGSNIETVDIAAHGFDVASISEVVDGQATAAQEIFYTLFE